MLQCLYINYKYFVIDDYLVDYIFIKCIFPICICILRTYVFILLLSGLVWQFIYNSVSCNICKTIVLYV